MISSIIIDDEPKARNLLKMVLNEYCKDVEVLAMCEDLSEGVKAIKKFKPGLVFLDIELPGHSGLELLDFFNDEEINFGIIFTTAYNDYAIQAFKLSAIDYLLKPIQHKLLIEAVERYKKQENQKQNQQLKNLQENLNAGTNWDAKRIAIPTGQTIRFIKPDDIILIKGEAAYSELFFADGTKLLASRNLKHFEEALAYYPFIFRCHKSFIVNLNAVTEYVKSDGGYLKLRTDLVAGLSPEKTDEFLKKMKD
ncbi:MAG: LytR/AlgR family response regulator transcription factor [Chitinophagaceae bacterium]